MLRPKRSAEGRAARQGLMEALNKVDPILRAPEAFVLVQRASVHRRAAPLSHLLAFISRLDGSRDPVRETTCPISTG
jgi:hypothetical protein